MARDIARAIASERLPYYDLHDHVFFNANTPMEYERAREMAAEAVR